MTRQKLQKTYWKKHRGLITKSHELNSTWENVIEMFEERINQYYLGPIENVEILGDRNGEGFTILTLQCVLIEMFAAFRKGQIYQPRIFDGDPLFIYDSSEQCVEEFLMSEKEFKNSFHPNKTKKVTAKEFFRNVRCGLMHEAKTKGEWTVNALKKYPEEISDFIEERAGKIRVDRYILNIQLRKYFQRYLSELREPNNDGKILRRLFGRKLDDLYDMRPDNYDPRYICDWWKEVPQL